MAIVLIVRSGRVNVVLAGFVILLEDTNTNRQKLCYERNRKDIFGELQTFRNSRKKHNHVIMLFQTKST